tara:strand:- start:555 stop:911 length:357 start_codon:yes stop_codon:yes gene_type:complete
MKVSAYKLFVEVSNGEVSPEEAQVKLLGLLKIVGNADPRIYIGQNIRNCKLAIYEVFWKSGGSSVASIGFTHDGTRWIAPTNWTFDQSKEGCGPASLIDDEMIDSIDRIEILYEQNNQ